MAVHRIAPLVYDVDSHSRIGVKHRVELEAWDGNGACVCEHFDIRLRPLLKAGAKRIGNNLRCKHIEEAFDEFAMEVMGLIRQRQKENGHAKKNAWHNG